MKPLSFVIITYNRPNDMLELLKNIQGLDNAAELLEEIIVVNNKSTVSYQAAESFITENKTLPYQYIIARENLGVSKGRNFALKKGKAPIVVMLDDDAVLENSDALVQIIEEFEKSNTLREKAIISFKVKYYDTLAMQESAFPHKKFKAYKDKSFFETYYYAGGAHAIKREIIEKLHYYPEDFFYGMEEYDLSYRVLDAGYSIVYSDKIAMLHKESPLGRKPKEEKLKMLWVNKSTVAYRYLPTIYFLSTSFMWMIYYLKNSGFNIGGCFSGLKKIFQIPATNKKATIKKSTLDYLKSLKARLYY